MSANYQNVMYQMPNAMYQNNMVASNIRTMPAPVLPSVQPSNNKPTYANQIANIKRDDFCFYSEGVYEIPKWEDYLNGMPVLDISAKFAIDFFIFKTEAKKSVKYRFSSKECDYIAKKSEQCMLLSSLYCLMNGAKSNNTTANGIENQPGYIIKLKGGNMNGKTPVQILLEDASKRDDLIKQANYLSQKANDPKYATANMEQIKAIQNAIYLFDSGALKGISAQSTIIPIWEGMKTPSIKTVDKNGNTKARTIKITYDLANKEQPFNVQIMNCMAPPVPNSKVGAYLSKAVDVATYNFNMSECEWISFISSISDTSKMIQNLFTRSIYDIYDKYRWKRQ